MTYEEVAMRYLTPLELERWYHNSESHFNDDHTPTDYCGLDEMCVSHLFQWNDTPEGHEYWYVIYLRIEDGERNEVLVPSRSITKHSIAM